MIDYFVLVKLIRSPVHRPCGNHRCVNCLLGNHVVIYYWIARFKCSVSDDY